jgi:hypothetical protein
MRSPEAGSDKAAEPDMVRASARNVGYSRSHGPAGVTFAGTGTPSRTGFVPESRLTLTAAEWVLDGARVLLEYSHNWDYPSTKGSTGQQADGVFAALTYTW